MGQRILIFRLLVFLFCVYNLSALTKEVIVGQAKVIDGDTIHIGKDKIRLYGIDAPEIEQICSKNNEKWKCGKSARLKLIEKINQNKVSCEVLDVDKYKRKIAECFINKVSINAYMVLEGWALAYRYYSIKYVREETLAKKNLKGIWNSEFKVPWEYRKK